MTRSYQKRDNCYVVINKTTTTTKKDENILQLQYHVIAAYSTFEINHPLNQNTNGMQQTYNLEITKVGGRNMALKFGLQMNLGSEQTQANLFIGYLCEAMIISPN